MDPITNETTRLVVEFATFVRQHPDLNLYPVSEETALFIVEDQDVASGQKTWHTITEPCWQYGNISRLCRDRVCRAETGELFIEGKRLKAEAYLGIWRKAIKNAVSFPGLLSMGFALSVTIPRPTGFCLSTPTGDDEARLRQHLDSPLITTRNEERITWRIPLTDAASFMVANDLRSAYWSREKYPGDYHATWEISRPDFDLAPLDDEPSSWQFELPALLEESLA